jgi:uncharacterized membrane protein YidH (DUF202 family)
MPSDHDASTYLVVGLADAVVPIAIAIAAYRRQARRHIAAWPTKSVAKGDEAAYRSMEIVLEAASVPARVRVAACLAFLDPAMALPMLAMVAAQWRPDRVSGARSDDSVPMVVAVLGLAVVVAVCAISVAVGQAILARKSSPLLAYSVGVGLIVQGVALLGLGVFRWSSLALRVAQIMDQPQYVPPSFGPTTLTVAVAMAVLTWPAFEVATGVAFATAASDLASAGPPSTGRAA